MFTLFILVTFLQDYALILFGETWCWSLLGLTLISQSMVTFKTQGSNLILGSFATSKMKTLLLVYSFWVAPVALSSLYKEIHKNYLHLKLRNKQECHTFYWLSLHVEKKQSWHCLKSLNEKTLSLWANGWGRKA